MRYLSHTPVLAIPVNHCRLLAYLHCRAILRRQIRAWLKAGAMDGKQLFPTNEGTPQGGVISPLLANIALHGMEEHIKSLARQFDMPRANGNQQSITVKRQSVSVIRYADDFVIFHQRYRGHRAVQSRDRRLAGGHGLSVENQVKQD